jgi:hypothetical protein
VWAFEKKPPLTKHLNVHRFNGPLTVGNGCCALRRDRECAAEAAAAGVAAGAAGAEEGGGVTERALEEAGRRGGLAEALRLLTGPGQAPALAMAARYGPGSGGGGRVVVVVVVCLWGGA